MSVDELIGSTNEDRVGAIAEFLTSRNRSDLFVTDKPKNFTSESVLREPLASWVVYQHKPRL